MKKTLIEFALSEKLIHKGDKILCAVSGGADSVALLLCLLQAAPQLGITVSAAHYNHGIRRAADGDEEFVMQLCRGLNVEFVSEKGDVPAFAKETGMGMEQAAREMRYEFLQRAAEKLDADCIATAHTADDNLETVIMNLTRGSGIRGAAGIPPRRGNIIRPMLSISREMVEQFLHQNRQSHVEDETNASDDYTRNKIRHHVVPVLKEINPRAAVTVSASALRMRRENQVLEDMADKLAEKAYEQGGRIKISICELAEADTAISARCVMRLLARLSSNTPEAVHIDSVLALINGERTTASCTLPDGIEARRQYDLLILGKAEPKRQLVFRTLEVNGKIRLEEIDAEISCSDETDENVYNSVNTFVLERGMICGDISVRSRQTGDKIKLKGRPEKSLKKLFIEKKIPADVREIIPVIADDEKVLAVAGIGADERLSKDIKKPIIIKVMYGGNG